MIAVGLVHVFGSLILPILRQRKYAHIRLAPMARFKVHSTKRVYQDRLLPPINVITEELLSNQNSKPTAIGQLHEKCCRKEKKLNLLTNSPKFLNDTMIYLKIQTFTTMI